MDPRDPRNARQASHRHIVDVIQRAWSILNDGVREIWAKRDLDEGDVQYMLYSADSAHDTAQEEITFEPANGCLHQSTGGSGPWLRTLHSNSHIGYGYAP
jgi:hypothetical protein